MAVPSSGTISLWGIAKEVEINDYNNTIPFHTYDDFYVIPISLTNMSTGAGGFDAINSGSSSKPNSSIPHSMSEFYGYDHDASPITQIGSTYSGAYSCSSYQNISIPVSAYKGKTVRFIFHYVSGSNYTGDLQIDQVAVPNYNNYWQQTYYNFGTSSLSAGFFQTNSNNTSDYLSVSFTSIGTSTGNYGRFVGRSGGTPSGSTGINSGYNGSGYYVYAEASGNGSGYPGKNFWLTTGDVVLANQVGTPIFGFRLGRCGSTIGTLKIYVREV